MLYATEFKIEAAVTYMRPTRLEMEEPQEPGKTVADDGGEQVAGFLKWKPQTAHSVG